MTAERDRHPVPLGPGPEQTVTVKRERSLDAVSDEWDALGDRVRAAPFLRPGWFRAWRDAFEKRDLEILVARRDGRLVGVLPLRTEGAVVRSATNDHSSMFEPLAEDGLVTRALAREVFARRSRRVSLFFLPRDGDSTAALRSAASAASYRVIERPLMRSPFISLSLEHEAYERTLASKVRSEIRRRRRRLAEQGRVTLEVSDAKRGLHGLLDEGFGVEGAGWKRSAGTAISSHHRTERFYRELSAWARDRGMLRLAFLRLDGRPLAFDLCLETETTHYLVKTGYDPAYRRSAPGMIIRREMIARAFESGLASYELLGDEEDWKLRWARESREWVVLRAFAPSPSGRLNWGTVAYARPLAKRVVRRR